MYMYVCTYSERRRQRETDRRIVKVICLIIVSLAMAAVSKVKDLVSSNPLIVFSKSYCPYCARVKQLLSSLGAKSKVIELDQENDGSELQSALAEWTGQRSVPNVFIGGNHIGGCDTTVAKHEAGQLLPLLQDAKAI